jgi:cyclohexa-1,5-dienecarbonyl-CoA hydratase
MPHVRLEMDGPVARLAWTRPPLNVFTIAMMEEAREALARVASCGARAMIVSGEGKAFSAGVDVGEHLGETVKPMIRGFHALFRAIRALPCAVVAAVHGACLGGGAELLLACDAVVAGEDATIGFPEIGLGVFPPIACAVLHRAVGETHARRLILGGETVSGAEAARIGLATRAVPAASLAAAADAEAALFTRHSGAALRVTRRAFPEADLERIEKIYLGELMRTADAGEGLKAFLEKRAPAWRHR